MHNRTSRFNIALLTKGVIWQDRGGQPLLSPEDMQRIVGPGAKDAFGKGNVNVGDGGVAFLLASAGTIPGGAPLVSAPAGCNLCSRVTMKTQHALVCCSCS